MANWMLKYFSFRHAGRSLYSALAFWRSNVIPGRFTTYQSLSTCRVCSWQEFSGILEFLEGIWKNLTGVNVNTLEMWPDRIRSLHATARWHMCLQDFVTI